jgi:hypothetical protein
MDMIKLAAFTLLALAAVTPAAQARVHSITPFQTLTWPNSDQYPDFGADAVAIDGDSIILIVNFDGPTHAALLFRRGSHGQWTYNRTLMQVSGPTTAWRSVVAMKNNLAIVKLDGGAVIWEKVANSWVRMPNATPIPGPGGFAISGNSILVGSDGCTSDALVYQKSATDGTWVVTGKISPTSGVCADQERDVELNYDYAFIHSSPGVVNVHHKNGTLFTWDYSNPILLTGQAAQRTGPVAVQKTTAVAPGSAYFTRSGTTWSFKGQLMPIDYAMGTGDATQVLYRDSKLVATEGWATPRFPREPYVYVANSSGNFEHVAILKLGNGGTVGDLDISGNTAVVESFTQLGSIIGQVDVFVLPSPLVAPPAIANNFEAGDVSGFTQSPGSQFALAGYPAHYSYRQSNTSGEASAALTNSDWRYYQSIDADVSPSLLTGDSWVGLAVRYVDADNYYFVSLGNTNVAQIGKKINGVVTTLAEGPLVGNPNELLHLTLKIRDGHLWALGNGQIMVEADDSTLTHGRAALVTHRAIAHFDNLYVTPTASTPLLSRHYVEDDYGRPFKSVGGNWHESTSGFQQSDTSGNAFAVIGTPTDNQAVVVTAALDTFATTNPVAWFGVVARYVDARNYYYLSIRSSNSLQIRKVVDGVVTMLKGVTYGVTPGAYHRYQFDVLGNELTASVDGVVVATAIDDSLTKGQYGLATYRAAATYQLVSVTQP